MVIRPATQIAADAASGTVSRVAFHVVEPDGAIEAEEVSLTPADVVVANILARPLVELAPRIAALTRHGGGQIVLAGLLEEQVRTASCGRWMDFAEWNADDAMSSTLFVLKPLVGHVHVKTHTGRDGDGGVPAVVRRHPAGAGPGGLGAACGHAEQ